MQTLKVRSLSFGLVALALLFVCAMVVSADSVAVRQTEGEIHGFLVLTTLDGVTIADGDSIQSSRGGKVTTRLVFHFKDGS